MNPASQETLAIVPQTSAAAPTLSLVPSMDTVNRVVEITKLAAVSGLLKSNARDTQQRRADAFFIAMTGYEVGLQPMAALRLLYVLNGQVTMGAQAMLSLARSKGVTVELPDPGKVVSSATVTITRPGDSKAYEFTYTLQMAKQAGLVSSYTVSDNEVTIQGKNNWKNHYREMLVNRAATMGLRFHAGDYVNGMYSVEEIAPDVDVDAEGTPTQPYADIEIVDKQGSDNSPAASNEDVTNAEYADNPESPEPKTAKTWVEELGGDATKCKQWIKRTMARWHVDAKPSEINAEASKWSEISLSLADLNKALKELASRKAQAKSTKPAQDDNSDSDSDAFGPDEAQAIANTYATYYYMKDKDFWAWLGKEGSSFTSEKSLKGAIANKFGRSKPALMVNKIDFQEAVTTFHTLSGHTIRYDKDIFESSDFIISQIGEFGEAYGDKYGFEGIEADTTIDLDLDMTDQLLVSWERVDGVLVVTGVKAPMFIPF